MSNIISTIKKLSAMESLGPASNEVITNAEVSLNLKFAGDYKEYLSVFGMVWSDNIAISGITDDEDYGVVELTNKLRPFYTQVPLNFYAIEDVGVDGLVIWQDESSAIYQSIPNNEPMRLYDNLSDYLEYVMEG